MNNFDGEHYREIGKAGYPYENKSFVTFAIKTR